MVCVTDVIPVHWALARQGLLLMTGPTLNFSSDDGWNDDAVQKWAQSGKPSSCRVTGCPPMHQTSISERKPQPLNGPYQEEAGKYIATTDGRLHNTGGKVRALSQTWNYCL
uniref:Uncharacterized protein n=1 Tax=Photinus pyralis TaxID=7054 RepID=A0A1Y1K9R1_PHOPY